MSDTSDMSAAAGAAAGTAADNARSKADRASTATSLLPGIAAGVISVLAAAIIGWLLAAFLAAADLTTTSVFKLGLWLAGGGLLGGWRQDVESSFGPSMSWHVTASFAPLLITFVAWTTVAGVARRTKGSGAVGADPARCASARDVVVRRTKGSGAVGAIGAFIGAGIAAALLVALSGQGYVAANAAGTVRVDEGTTWWWSHWGHPGAFVGAAVLAAVAWFLHATGREWWRSGRNLVFWLLVVPGLVLTIVAATTVWYLTSSPALAAATVLLAPLLGSLAVLALGGTPVELGLTRVVPEPIVVSTWERGWITGIACVIVLIIYCWLVGAILGRRGSADHGWAAFCVVVISGAFLDWAQQALVSVPSGLGAPTALSASVIFGAAVAALMAVVALLARWRTARRWAARRA